MGMVVTCSVFAAVTGIAISRGMTAQAQERFSVWDGVYT